MRYAFRISLAAIAGLIVLAVLLPVLVPGCSVIDYHLRDTVDPDTGSITVSGLKADVDIRRDDLGIPVIDARNMSDAAYAAGYVMAADRLSQMVTYCLIGQGRLAEMVGPPAVDIDVYIRALGLPERAKRQYAMLSDDVKQMLTHFSKGVNAYIHTHRDRLPPALQMTGYRPETWKPVHSFYIYNVLNLGLSFNVREEMAFLNLAQKLGANKAAWLFPVYPDEPLPFHKAAALADLDFNGISETTGRLADLEDRLARILMPLGVAASNNWAVSPQRAARDATIVANDTHLPLEHPPVWMLMQLKTPEFHVAGVAMPGIPGIVAGYNGHIAWGMTMVMGDSQDLFIEKLKTVDGEPCYKYQGRYQPVQTRTEVFEVKGKDPVKKTISTTRHGPLLNSVLTSAPKHPMMPPAAESRYGIALRTTAPETDMSFDGMYELNRAETMAEARAAIEKVRFMNLNLVYGDAKNIAWQVSGCYPVRSKGRGHLPSPGWTGAYDWDGYLPVKDHPYVKNPRRGFLYTANHRTVSPEKGPLLGSSWYAPERAGRIGELLDQKNAYTWADAVAMQHDRFDRLVPKLKQLLFDASMGRSVESVINNWPDTRRKDRARRALAVLADFDGRMLAKSSGAAFFGIFHHYFIRNLFFDELGPEKSAAWGSYQVLNSGIYAADQDHLLGRKDSPFWDNVHTDAVETKADILAETLADAMGYAEKRLGGDQSDWQWGDLHTYEWQTAMTKMRPHMGAFKSFFAWLAAQYTDRGPYPAGGDLNTINVAGHRKGQNYDVWLVPAMRMVVDFGRKEPLFLVNSGGQSGNPASPHFDDGIPVWLTSGNRQMPFGEKNLASHYDRVFVLEAEGERR
ncbi:MAG: penicillin acylase family protein [Thermodesulfobacteriota bacterium]